MKIMFLLFVFWLTCQLLVSGLIILRYYLFNLCFRHYANIYIYI